MLSVLHKIIRVALVVIPIFIFGWLTVKEIVPSGKVLASYDMQQETPFISKLYPKDRVSEIGAGADGGLSRSFLAEPVYFDLAPNDKFEKVAVTIKYKNSGTVPAKIGALIDKAAWSFDSRELASTGRKWRTQTEIFDFSKMAAEGKKYRIGFFAAGMPSGQIEVGEIKVLFVRPELDEKGIVNKILDGITWRMNKIFSRYDIERIFL